MTQVVTGNRTWEIGADTRPIVRILRDLQKKKDIWVENGALALCQHAERQPYVHTPCSVEAVPMNRWLPHAREYLRMREQMRSAGYLSMPLITGLLFLEQADLDELTTTQLILCHEPVAMPRKNNPRLTRKFCLKIFQGRVRLVLSMIRHQTIPTPEGGYLAFQMPHDKT